MNNENKPNQEILKIGTNPNQYKCDIEFAESHYCQHFANHQYESNKFCREHADNYEAIRNNINQSK